MTWGIARAVAGKLGYVSAIPRRFNQFSPQHLRNFNYTRTNTKTGEVVLLTSREYSLASFNEWLIRSNAAAKMIGSPWINEAAPQGTIQ